MATTPSLKHNIFANYIAQIFTAAIGIIMAPVYLHYMGTEAYGLIGFFTMMGAWFSLLDIGLTPTLIHEAARFRGGAINTRTFRAFLRVLEVLFASVSLVGAVVMFLFSDYIAAHWLNVRQLPIEQVSHSVALMALTIPLRLIAGLYRGVVTGFERLVWLSTFNVFIAVVRYLGVLLIFMTLGTLPLPFFSYQLIVAAVELGGVAIFTYRLVSRPAGPDERFEWKPILGTLKFALAISATSTISVVLGQTDKLILSKLLTLGQYGVFSVAVTAAAGIMMIASPFGLALLPRLTKMVAEKDFNGFARLYSGATQSVCTLVTPVVVVLSCFATPVLFAWTGNPQMARNAAPILSFYSIGYGWVALGSFPFYLQYAKSDLYLHFIGNFVLMVILMPLFFWSARYYGAVGTGAVWAITNGLYTLGWSPVIHRRLYKGQHWPWMIDDVLPIVVPTACAGWLLALIVPWPSGRWETFALVVALGTALLAIAASGSSLVRKTMLPRIAAWVAR
jgi:O-antigen/teichoic acid export membrane protein